MPLSPAAIALLKALPTESGNPNLFIGARGDRTSQAAVTVLPERLGYDVTVHGFRSTFADWCHERRRRNHDVEMSLAHAVGSDVERSYRRTDLFAKRAKLMAGGPPSPPRRPRRCRCAAEGPLSVGVSGDVRYKPVGHWCGMWYAGCPLRKKSIPAFVEMGA